MLTQRTFATKDSKGCEFICKCQIVRKYANGPIIESHYYAIGLNIQATNLKDLKKKVGEL